MRCKVYVEFHLGRFFIRKFCVAFGLGHIVPKAPETTAFKSLVFIGK